MDAHRNEKSKSDCDGWRIHEAWDSYEKIAMHFNDLLIRLRIQALGGVATLSTLVGIFTKTETRTTQGSWEIAAAVFGALAIFWIAIWILDIKYYNRLLLGAVRAILELEERSATETHVRSINMSSLISAAFGPDPILLEQPRRRVPRPLTGIYWFYSLVLFALSLGFCFSVNKHFDGAPMQWFLTHINIKGIGQ